VPGLTPQVLYVKTHLANFREGAGTSRKILRVLRQGARLQVLETRTTWLRVRLDDGLEGWVAESVTSVTAPVTPARAPAPRSRPFRVVAA
jgi:SH3-like domain-containing protein